MGQIKESVPADGTPSYRLVIDVVVMMTVMVTMMTGLRGRSLCHGGQTECRQTTHQNGLFELEHSFHLTFNC